MARLLSVDSLLWICIGLLLTGLAHEWARDPVKLPPPISDQPTAIPAVRQLHVPSDTGSTPHVLDEHPLFSPYRKMLAAKERPVTTRSISLPDIELRAIIVEGEKRSILLRRHGASQSERMSAGQQIGAWRLVRIEDQAVILEARGQRHRLALRKPTPDPNIPTGETTKPGAHAGAPLTHSLSLYPSSKP